MVADGVLAGGPLVTQAETVGEADASDEALAVRGDAESLMLLYRRYLVPVYRYLYARLGNRVEAEDVCSVAWERVLGSLPHYKPTGQFRSWLFTIARRALADHLRSRPVAPVPIEGLENELLDGHIGPEDEAISLEESHRVLSSLRELGPEQVEIIMLRFMSGLSYGEIAKVMGKREAAVKMMAYRALAELRKRCGDVRE